MTDEQKPRRGDRPGKIANQERKAAQPPAKHKVPVSQPCQQPNVDGEVFLYLFPMAGTAKQFMMWVSELVLQEKEKAIPAYLMIHSGTETRKIEVLLKKGANSLDQRFDVKRGDFASVAIEPELTNDGTRKIAGLVTSFVYEVD